MRVLFLINDGFGIGGTIKTTFNLGEALVARGHEVEVLSTVRRRDVPQMPVPAGIRLVPLVETRSGHPDHEPDAPGRGRPPRVYPKADYRSADYDAYVEERYRRHLAATDADVVIATRPGLIAYLARFAPSRTVRIGQEHLVRGQHRKAMREALPKHLRGIDAFVTVSRRDAEDYRAHTRMGGTRLLHIPNSIPATGVAPSTGRAKLVVAAGRLVKSKRYDVLIRAFAKVVAERPDWRLRVYGNGDQSDDLRALVLELGLHNHVRMMGGYTPIEPEWAKGSIAAVSADKEPFGMTLVEAMRVGVPVVSTDAPYGPGEILTDGVDGLLTPVGDPDALGAALLRLINDDELRRSMGAAALESAARYDPEPIAERYEQLFTEIAAGKRWWQKRRQPVPNPLKTLDPVRSVTLPTLDWDGVAPLPDGTRWAQDDPESPQWRLLTEDGTPLQAGLRDTRHLLEDPPGDRIRLPFRRPDGTMGVRVHEQQVWAEPGEVQADENGVHLTGRLIGAAFGTQPAILARHGDKEISLTVTTEGDAFRAVITGLTPGDWELWLRHADGPPPVRIGGFRDDIVDKRLAYVLPAAKIGDVTLQPGYLPGGELTIRVTT